MVRPHRRQHGRLERTQCSASTPRRSEHGPSPSSRAGTFATTATPCSPGPSRCSVPTPRTPPRSDNEPVKPSPWNVNVVALIIARLRVEMTPGPRGEVALDRVVAGLSCWLGRQPSLLLHSPHQPLDDLRVYEQSMGAERREVEDRWAAGRSTSALTMSSPDRRRRTPRRPQPPPQPRHTGWTVPVRSTALSAEVWAQAQAARHRRQADRSQVRRAEGSDVTDWADARAEMYVWLDYDLHRTPEVTGSQDRTRVRPLAGRRRTARRHARAPMPARRRDGPAPNGTPRQRPMPTCWRRRRRRAHPPADQGGSND